MIPDFIRNAGSELPFILLLIALLGFRSRVTPRASLFIGAPPEKVFALVEKLIPRVEALKVGLSTGREADYGPLVTKQALDRVKG